jgi:predicted mannosyl-3-phosphoglycerate phosphatase (HAD superfamily)
MIDKYSNKELSVRLRKVLDKLEKVSDEVIVSRLDESEDTESGDKTQH